MNSKRRSHFELLEGRAMMAGDVLVAVNAGNIKMTGDALANEIAIVDLGGGKITVTGQPGTTVNGLTGAQTFNGITGSLLANLRDGADQVQFLGNAGHELSSIQISTGGGDDTVSVDKVFAREVSIGTGAGNDTVNIMEVTAKSVSVETGAGDDTLVVGSTLATRHDVLIKVREFEIETGDGKDKVSILDAVLQTGEFEVNTGLGDDIVKVNDVQAQGEVEIETGMGHDSVSIVDSTFVKLAVDLGAGDGDSLAISNTKSIRTRLDGGLGANDSLKITSSTLGTLSQTGFEPVGLG